MLKLKRGQRAIIAGMTGSGKSTLAKVLLSKTTQLRVIADPKGDFDFPDCIVVDDPEELSKFKRSEGKGLIYRPAPEFWTHEHWDGFFNWAYRLQNIFLYVDEMYGVMPDGRKLNWLQACLTRGRSLGITFAGCTQRPSGIPISLMTESEFRYMFHLSWLDDKKRMSEIMPGTTTINGKDVPTVLTPLKSPHNFYFYDTTSRINTREFCLTFDRKNRVPAIGTQEGTHK